MPIPLTTLASYDTRHIRATRFTSPTVSRIQASNSTSARSRVFTLRANRITKPDERVDIVLSNKPRTILFRDIPYRMLIDFCGALLIRQYTVHPSPESRILILPAQKCEALGLDIVLSWMVTAYEKATHDIIPAEKHSAKLLTCCCVERALTVLGLYTERDAMRIELEREMLTQEFPVCDLMAVWRSLPRGSYWVNKVLDHIRSRLVKK